MKKKEKFHLRFSPKFRNIYFLSSFWAPLRILDTIFITSWCSKLLKFVARSNPLLTLRINEVFFFKSSHLFHSFLPIFVLTGLSCLYFFLLETSDTIQKHELLIGHRLHTTYMIKSFVSSFLQVCKKFDVYSLRSFFISNDNVKLKTPFVRIY